ncbi:FtsK/SpoIIIE domain-containing protein [Actinomyces lilanjuaniae]|uniref:FtsK/SpoIIIE domain-containing protein n=1 Tax=Actinomyces lilanjuaniae TaxID=2321394 RepID=UPI00196950C7|nr:FtsK/SpoIIIE domain-containing protein [Actinomyces lilanjuaniae]
MQLLVSVVRPQAREPVIRDLVVTAQGDSTVADLAAALDTSVPDDAVAAASGAADGAALRLVVSAGQARSQEGSAVGLWAGTARLDPGDLLAGGPVHDGMVLGLGDAVQEDAELGEPAGVVELRVVSGYGAGAVHRLGLGTYTLGGDGCDIALELPGPGSPEGEDCPGPVEGLEPGARVATVSVRAGGEVVLAVDPEVAERMAPVPALRQRRLPGPLVLESRDEVNQGKDGGSIRRRGRRRRRQKEGDPVLWGREEVDPDAPRHLVELDRRPVTREVSWREGAVLRVGRTLLTVGAIPEADAVTSPTPEATTLDFNRPPRLARPGRRTEFALPRPPQRPRRQPFPFSMMVSPMVMGAGMYLVTGRVYSLLFMVLSPVMMIANRIQGRSSSRRTYRENLRRYEQQRGEVEEAAFRALSEERRLRRCDSPDPAEVLLRATGPRSTLWERRPTDPDWLELRVGTADLPSDVVLQDPDRAQHEEELRWTAPDVPVTVPVARTGVVGVCGAHRHRLAAWLTAQAAALHSPAELEMVLLMDLEEGEVARSRWEWARWLPHLRGAEGVGARVRVGVDEESVARRVGELVDLVDARREQGEAAGTGVVPTEQVLVVLDGAHALRQRPGMVHVLRAGPSVGVHVVCVDTDRTWLPEECRAVVEAGATGASVSLTGRDQVEQVLVDLVPPGWCERLARCLAPVNDVSAQGAEGAVPSSSRLLDVLDLPEPDAQAVLERWRQVGRTTRAVIGEDAEGLFSVDVSAHGPHALVAGTTGSGKSELLQTLIASLCVGNTPEAMTFVLVDYKGGAAFKDCARLPHTVGMVTDLDGHLTSRALESLGAELRRREHQLAGAGAKDIEDYVAAAGPDDEPMPRLMIIIDEFAALVAELPEFVEGLVDVARRGRSLGVHLVLATQRPAGVVSAEIKSNTNLRIALRVTDENDSQDVVETSVAARVPPSIPGRAWARLGHASLRAFQSSRVGAARPGRGRVRACAPCP